MWCVGGIANSDDCVRGLLRFKRRRLRLGPQRVGGLPAVRSSFPAVSAARVVWALVFGMSVAAHPLSGAAAEPGYLFGAERSAQSDAFAQVGIDGWRREAVEQAPADMQLGNDVDSSARLLAQARASDARGDIDTAQRLYEHLVARDPASSAAMDARRRLGEIYRGEHVVAAGNGDGPAQAAPAIVREGLPDVSPAPSELPATTGSVEPSGGAAGGGAAGQSPFDASRASRTRIGEGRPGADPALAREAVVAAPSDDTAASRLATPQSWRPRARRSHRFEQLLRIDVGDRVFFGVTSAQIGARARSVLESQAAWLARYPDLYVVVEGHADEPGSEADNDRVARARAETARALLIAAGVKAERVDIDVRGSKDRVAVCESGGCRAQNRRAVIRLMVVLPAPSGDRS